MSGFVDLCYVSRLLSLGVFIFIFFFFFYVKKKLRVEQMLAGMKKISFSIWKHEANKAHKMASFHFEMFDVGLVIMYGMVCTHELNVKSFWSLKGFLTVWVRN